MKAACMHARTQQAHLHLEPGPYNCMAPVTFSSRDDVTELSTPITKSQAGRSPLLSKHHERQVTEHAVGLAHSREH